MFKDKILLITGGTGSPNQVVSSITLKAWLPAASAVILLCLLPASGLCAETNISAAAFLAGQPRPNFKPGHHLPHLTRWGGSLPLDVRVELARSWGYALEFSPYARWDDVVTGLRDSNSVVSRVCALAASDPQRFPLAVLMDRELPKPIPDEYWVRDEQGRFTDGKSTWEDAADTTHHKVVSPEAPEDYWRKAAQKWVEPLKLLRQSAPIAILLNGGEYGVNVAGFGANVWGKDPRVQAARGNRPWFDYASARKGRNEEIVAKAMREALPDRELYIYYHTGGESRRKTQDEGWKNWAFDSAALRNITDLPSFECYYGSYNTGWQGNQDLLTLFLDSVGYNEGLGAPLSYNWVCAGWEERTGFKSFSDIPRYTGYLKCLYTAGMVGGVAGYFGYLKDGFDAGFPSDNPPHWLRQMLALARVHALFSHLEPFLRQGYLLPGPLLHKWSKDQPAYEFPTGDAGVRVLARKLRAGDHWLVTAWAAEGSDREVKVEIPDLGPLTLRARDSGAVFHVTRARGEAKTTLLDENGILPTANLPVIELN
jgi:hypothetical protein